MHQQIVCAVPGKVIDHRDGDGCNNRRENLRIATWQQNAMNRPTYTSNTTGHKGVCIDSPGRWRASIGHGGKQIYLGLFESAEAAGAAYVEAARRLHGEFANWKA